MSTDYNFRCCGKTCDIPTRDVRRIIAALVLAPKFKDLINNDLTNNANVEAVLGYSFSWPSTAVFLAEHSGHAIEIEDSYGWKYDAKGNRICAHAFDPRETGLRWCTKCYTAESDL